jgi:hypothetical protein
MRAFRPLALLPGLLPRLLLSFRHSCLRVHVCPQGSACDGGPWRGPGVSAVASDGWDSNLCPWCVRRQGLFAVVADVTFTSMEAKELVETAVLLCAHWAPFVLLAVCPVWP